MNSNTSFVTEKPLSSVGVGLAKYLLFKLLSQLEQGHLTIVDQGNTYTFGYASSALHAQITIHDPAIYRRILLGGGSLAAGETYVEGLWDTPDLTKVVQLLVRNRAVLDGLDHGFSFFISHKFIIFFKFF